MHLSIDADHIERQIEVQVTLAALAEIDKIRAMHQDLERLYRSQLVALVTAERLAASVAVAVEAIGMDRASGMA